jgi:argininosuccinate lyase
LQGIPFRETHHISGEAVRLAEDRGCQLSELSIDDLQGIHPLFQENVAEVWSFERSAAMRDTDGGASKRSLLQQVEKMRKYLKEEDS